MRLNNPDQIRQMYAKKKWLTVVKISAELNMSHQTISRALAGESVRPATILRLAESLQLEPTDIATFVTSQ